MTGDEWRAEVKRAQAANAARQRNRRGRRKQLPDVRAGMLRVLPPGQDGAGLLDGNGGQDGAGQDGPGGWVKAVSSKTRRR